MERFYKVLVAAFFASVIIGVGLTSTNAQEKPAAAKKPAAAQPSLNEVQPITLRIAVIDVDSIRGVAKVVKNIGGQIKKYRDKFQADINSDEKKLRDKQEELKRQEAILSEDAFKLNVQKFQKSVQETQIKIQLLKQQLAKAQGESMRKVERALNGIIDNLVEELDLHLVLRREPVVYYNQGLDLTKLVLERLDKQMPSLKVPTIKTPTGKPKAKAKAKSPAKAKAPAAKK